MWETQSAVVAETSLDGAKTTTLALADQVRAEPEVTNLGGYPIGVVPALLPGPPALHTYEETVSGRSHRFMVVTFVAGKNSYRFSKDLGPADAAAEITPNAGTWLLTPEGYLVFFDPSEHSATSPLQVFQFSMDDLTPGAQAQTAYFS